VTGSIDEVRAALAVVVERLGSAGQFAGRAGTLIDDAVAALTELSEQHSESLVPEELLRAVDELSAARGMIRAGSTAVLDIEARL
jgi:hypothetical protein